MQECFHRTIRLALTLPLVGLLGSCLGSSPTEPLPEKPWTFLVYDAADFSPAYDLLRDFSAGANYVEGFFTQVRSGDNLNVLVLVDRATTPAEIFYVDEDHTAVSIRELGEVNTGHWETLSGFLEYAKEFYPAERYIVSFFGHGGGWRGTGVDQTSGNDWLTMGEIKQALSHAGGADLVLLNGPCFMGSLEAAYDLRDHTDVYVGSEAISGWVNKPMGDLSEALHENPEISNYELGALVVNSIWEHRMVWAPWDWDKLLTASAVRTDGLGALAGAVDELSMTYLADMDRLRRLVDAVYSNVTSFGSSFLDLHDLAEELLSVEQDQESREILLSLQHVLDDAVIAEVHGSEWPDAHGLTIFLPDTSSVDLLYSYTSTARFDLDFVRHTHWDEMLTSLFDNVSVPQESVFEFGIPATNGSVASDRVTSQ